MDHGEILTGQTKALALYLPANRSLQGTSLEYLAVSVFSAWIITFSSMGFRLPETELVLGDPEEVPTEI